jgi:hypothetical protein
MPDNTPFRQFFLAVARGSLKKNKNLSKQIFRILALREKLQASEQQAPEQNLVDLLIRKTLCFYRESKDPLRSIAYDDPAFVQFLQSSLTVLESKVEQTILDSLKNRQQRKEYERLLNENQALEDSVKGQAEVDADRNFERLSQSARKKAHAP